MEESLSQPRIDRSLAWEFALSQYQRPAVARACLSLQDDFNCNINLVLFCLYAETLSYSLTVKELLLIEKTITDSEQQLKRHRSRRRKAKTATPDCYQALLEQELVLEQKQHQLIIDGANSVLAERTENRSAALPEWLDRSLPQYLKLYKLNQQQIKKYCDIIIQTL
jgi:uncharacterized protein (TIGR02444 family)